MAKRRGIAGWKKYREATTGPSWAAFRRRILELRGGKCEHCAKKSDPSVGIYLHLHHKHYKTLGREQPEDVELLCNVCHGLHHGIDVVPKPGRWKLPKRPKVIKRNKPKKAKRRPAWTEAEKQAIAAEVQKKLGKPRPCATDFRAKLFQ